MIELLISEIPKNIDTKGLPDKEVTKISQYKSLKKQRESLYGLCLLKDLLNNIGIKIFTIDYKKHKKPFLLNDHYKFNISHSHETVICALSNNEIGVDIEYLDHKVVRVKEKFVSKTELDKLTSLSDNDLKTELTKIWVLKESFLKYLGIGISIDLTAIEIKEEKNVYHLFYNNQKAEAIVYQYEEYLVSICTKNSEKTHITKRGQSHEY